MHAVIFFNKKWNNFSQIKISRCKYSYWTATAIREKKILTTCISKIHNKQNIILQITSIRNIIK